MKSDGCYYPSVAYIGNGFDGDYWNKGRVLLGGFDDKLSKKSIPMGASVIVIDLKNSTLIDNLNDNPILHRGDNSLTSTAQDCEFGVASHDVYYHHSVKYYIHSGDRFIP